MLQPSLDTAFLTVSKLVEDFENGKARYMDSDYSEQAAQHDFFDNKTTMIRKFS
jgi:hypothetical protein